jgi:predicted Zn finger-like uncharacterized protein
MFALLPGTAITMDVRCDRCQTEYELDDEIVTDAGASVQCTTCGHTFFVRRQGRGAPASSTASRTESSASGSVSAAHPAPESGLAAAGGPFPDLAPAAPEWTLDTEDGKLHRFRELNTLQKWIVERKVTREDRVAHSGGPWRTLGEIPELGPFFAVVEEADRARVRGAKAPAASGERATRVGPAGASPQATRPGGFSAVTSGAASGRSSEVDDDPMEPTLSFTVPVAEAFRRASEDGPTVPDRRVFDSGPAPKVGDARARTEASASREPSVPASVPPPVPVDAPRASGRGSSTTGPLPLGATPSGSFAPLNPHGMGPSSSAKVRQAAITENIFPTDAVAELSDLALLQPRRRRLGFVWALVVVLLVGGGAGYLWWRSFSESGHRSETVAERQVASAETPAAPAPLPPPAEPVKGTDTATAMAPATPPPTLPPPTPLPAPAARAPVEAPHPAGSPAERPAAGGEGRPVSYEKLVVEGNRLLARGSVAKASKLFDQALTMRPDGVMALTGTAYVHLDRQRQLKAIDFFQRALAVDPTHGPALFGIAEAYRAQGDAPEALAAYRQYLALAPSGADAPAARQQIKELSADDESP